MTYLSQDRAAAERLLADDLTFTSPQDDHIGQITDIQVFFGGRVRPRDYPVTSASV